MNHTSGSGRLLLAAICLVLLLLTMGAAEAECSDDPADEDINTDLWLPSQESIWQSLINRASTDSPEYTRCFALNENIVWAVGARGAIIQVVHMGGNSIQQTSGTDTDLNDVAFTDENHGVAVGDEGTALHTQDGGETWTAADSGTEEDLVAVDLLADDKSDQPRGWAVSRDGTVLRTVDGGMTWDVLPDSPGTELTGIHFGTPNQGYAVGGDKVFSTSDGGDSWHQTGTTPNGEKMRAVSCLTNCDSTGWAVGNDGAVLRTNTGGKEWAFSKVPTSPGFVAVRFDDTDGVGYAIDEFGSLWVSFDDGATWQAKDPPTDGLQLDNASFDRQSGGTVVGVTKDGLALYRPLNPGRAGTSSE